MMRIPDQPYAGPCPACARRGDKGLLQVVVGVTDDGTLVEAVEECTTPECSFFVRSYAPIDGPTRTEIRDAVHTIRSLPVHELQCPSCYGHMCWRCTTATCRCARGPHPKRGGDDAA